jgi:hypothetical protein
MQFNGRVAEVTPRSKLRAPIDGQRLLLLTRNSANRLEHFCGAAGHRAVGVVRGGRRGDVHRRRWVRGCGRGCS